MRSLKKRKALIPKYEKITLENGFEVYFAPVNEKSGVISVDLYYKVGSRDETLGKTGIAHMLEHMNFKSTKKHKAGEFDRIVKSFGGVDNASTGFDFTHYYITLPSSYFEVAMDLHADMLMNPLIPRKELEKERKVVIEEIAKNNDNPESKLYENMINAFYTNHPYKRKVIGKKEIIENITREEILDFYNTWYNPSNMITVVVGDVDTQKAIELIKKNFNRKETKKPCKPVYKKDSNGFSGS